MRTEDKVMNNGKLQAKQEELKSLHCPSPQSSLFDSRGSLLNTLRSKESAVRCAQSLFIDVSTKLLRRGQCVRFRAPGLSMHPTIKEGETITVIPVSSFEVKRGDILLYLVGKKVIAHRVVGIEKKKRDSSNQFSKFSPRLFLLRGDASTICDEPVEAQQILGKVVSVERDGRSINLCSRRAKIFRLAYKWASHLKRQILRLLRKYGQIFVSEKKQRGDFL
jgi:hypothetical protein